LPIDVLDKICEVLDCQPSDLMEYIKEGNWPRKGQKNFLNKNGILLNSFDCILSIKKLQVVSDVFLNTLGIRFLRSRRHINSHISK
jgi:hypothetical protein